MTLRVMKNILNNLLLFLLHMGLAFYRLDCKVNINIHNIYITHTYTHSYNI